jgi:hypothetical protein
MFDNLRELSDEPGRKERQAQTYQTYEEPPGRRLLGMTPGQRFLLSLMLLATVIVMGAMCLLVTGSVWLF